MTFTDHNVTAEVFPQDGGFSGISDGDADFLNAAYLGALASAETNDYVKEGMEVSIANGTLDMTAGIAFIEDDTDISFKRYDDADGVKSGTFSQPFSAAITTDAVSGIPLEAASGQNFVYLYYTHGGQNDVNLRVATQQSEAPTDPHLKLADIDPSRTGLSQFQTFENNRVASEDGLANVKDFGAKGDGVANDTEAIRDALKYSQQFGGGRVYIPPGTYLVGLGSVNDGPPTFDLRKYPGTEIFGAGYASKLKVPDGLASDDKEGVTVFRGGTDCHIHNFLVDGNKTGQQPVGDASDGANFVQLGGNTHFHHMWSINSPGDGVEPYGDNVTVQNCIFRDNTEQDVHLWGSGCTVSGNLMIGNSKDGSVRCYSTPKKRGDQEGHVITDNYIVDPATYGVQVSQNGAIAKNCRIASNVIIRPGQDDAVIGNEGQDSGMFFSTLRESVVADNMVIGAKGNGINVSPSGGTSRKATNDITITGNTVRECGGTGIRVGSSQGVDIRGNTIKRNGDHGITYTFNDANCPTDIIKVLNISDNQIIENNQNNNNKNGIFLFIGGGEIKNLRVIGNDILSPQSSNRPPHARAIVFNNAGGTLNNITLTDNIFGNTGATGRYLIPSEDAFKVVGRNSPRLRLDVRKLSPEWGDKAYHDASGTNNSPGEAQYIGFNNVDGESPKWISLTDGSVID